MNYGYFILDFLEVDIFLDEGIDYDGDFLFNFEEFWSNSVISI